jgi:hypothetical protein
VTFGWSGMALVRVEDDSRRRYGTGIQDFNGAREAFASPARLQVIDRLVAWVGLEPTTSAL